MPTRADEVLTSGGYATGAQRSMLDLSKGGQFGYATQLDQLISNSAYKQKNLQIYLLRAPGWMSLMPDKDKWVSALRSLVEVKPKRVDGYNASLNIETDTHAVGGGGEVQHEFTDVKRTPSQIQYLYQELDGMPITTFFSYWVQYGMMDPETKMALIGTLADQSKVPKDWLFDWYGMSTLAIETDVLGRRVVKSWITTNQFPMGEIEITGRRDLNAPSELKELTIQMTGTSQFGLGTDKWAQDFLNNISYANANPYLRAAMIQKIDADVAAAASTGFVFGVDQLAKSAVQGGAFVG